jgi:hypothetical protein
MVHDDHIDHDLPAKAVYEFYKVKAQASYYETMYFNSVKDRIKLNNDATRLSKELSNVRKAIIDVCL